MVPGSGSRKAKMTPKEKKKVGEKYYVLQGLEVFFGWL
jgi:hypothetical protein